MLLVHKHIFDDLSMFFASSVAGRYLSSAKQGPIRNIATLVKTTSQIYMSDRKGPFECSRSIQDGIGGKGGSRHAAIGGPKPKPRH